MSTKKTQHPVMTEVDVIMVDGSIKKMQFSSYPNKTLRLEVDRSTHRAWQGTSFVRGKKSDKARKKFGGDIEFRP